MIDQQPNIYLDEIQSGIESETGTQVSLSTIWRHLKNNGLTLKKVSVVAFFSTYFHCLFIVTDHEMCNGAR